MIISCLPNQLVETLIALAVIAIKSHAIDKSLYWLYGKHANDKQI